MAIVNGNFEIEITEAERLCDPLSNGRRTWALHNIRVRANVGELLYEVKRTVEIPPGYNFEAFMKSAEIQNAARQLFAEIAREL